MATPTNRIEFIEYCLRQLGAPVIDINVSPDQIEDRVDEAIQFFREYHSDSTDNDYYVYRIQASDVSNKYVTIPDNIIEVIRVYSSPSLSRFGGLFNFQYQFFLNDFYRPGGMGLGGNLANIDITMQYLDLIDHFFNQEKTVQFNRHLSKLYINIAWGTQLKVDDYIVVQVRRIFDLDANLKVWNDQWLKKYTIALIKRQWGSNLKKFAGVQLVGGVTLKGQELYDEANKEVEDLEAQVKSTWQEPPLFFVG